MAYQVGSMCYSTQQKAIEAIASSIDGQLSSISSQIFMINAQYSAPSSIQYSGTQLNGTTIFSKLVPIGLENCNIPDYSDGLQMGWLVAIVWIAAASIMIIKKGV